MSYKSKKPNDPAYPTATYSRTSGSLDGHFTGISIRDYFAAKAMQGILSAQTEKRANGNDNSAYDLGTIAHEAYLAADAMIDVRNLSIGDDSYFYEIHNPTTNE